ncbi:MAG: hypothetical protein NZM43_08350 [Saprospiraceae bacterium]|nr:hypothetical protein [Saprospiraceae bacterium]MDW8484320.1 hypothetical protein [Saprospiraceae bacterium]
MKSSWLLPNLGRLLALLAIQGLVLSDISYNTAGYVSILVYPLFILLLPILTPVPIAVIAGFVAGVLVDIFTGTLGLHASTGAFSGYARALILDRFAPQGGYTGKEVIASPAYFGWQWFLSVSSIFFAVHLLWYFSMAYFTPAYFFNKILPQAALSWVSTMPIVVILIWLFYPKN